MKGVNNNLVYQLVRQNMVIKLSMNKLVNTLNYIWVIKNNWLQYPTIHVFQKEAENGKHVYNIENLIIKHKNKFRLHNLH